MLHEAYQLHVVKQLKVSVVKRHKHCQINLRMVYNLSINSGISIKVRTTGSNNLQVITGSKSTHKYYQLHIKYYQQYFTVGAA